MENQSSNLQILLHKSKVKERMETQEFKAMKAQPDIHFGCECNLYLHMVHWNKIFLKTKLWNQIHRFGEQNECGSVV